MGYYLENVYKADPDHPVRQALSTRHNFRVIIEKLNNTISVVNNLVIRNNIVYTYIESVDATHPFEIDFHIPTVTATIKKISLTLKGVPFRAYSTANANSEILTSSAGGAQTSSAGGAQTSSGGGAAILTSSSGGGQTSTSAGAQTSTSESNYISNIYIVRTIDAGGHITSYYGPTGVSLSLHTHNIANHTHTVVDHTHTVTIANHTHTVADHTHTVADHTHTVPAHTHGITYGIYESTTPTAVNGYYDNSAGYSVADSYGNAPDTTTPWNIKTEYDITSKYTGTGWKRLKLDTSRLGRFNIILMVEVDLTPTV